MRGQAFEVFRLLIAAVVAGAILMVLLGLLQNLITPTTDPQTAAAQLVKKFATYGGTGSTDYIQFRRGMAIDARAIAREAYLKEDCVIVDADPALKNLFNCSNKQRCEYTSPTGTRAMIKVVCDLRQNLQGSFGGDCEKTDMACLITITR